ncbi:MAG: class I SAM-dependent methyltransferase [Solirubrobacterales bacterium]
MAGSSDSAAIGRLRELLDDVHRRAPFEPEVGYLDLLDDDRTVHSPVMRAMNMPLVTQVYERWWRPGWGRLMKGFGGPSMSAEYELAGELLALAPGARVLDLGCGPGNFTRRFAAAVGADGLAVGYDGSLPMLERAVTETPEDVASSLAYVRGDASRLPFVDGAFDAVCCFAALHMFPKPERTLAEVARVLRGGGRVALLTSYAPGGVLGAPARLAGPASGQRIFGRGEIRDLLSDAGFDVTDQRPSGVTQLVAATREPTPA